jgi:hypothetical protein
MKRIHHLVVVLGAMLLPAAVALAQVAPPQPNIPQGQRSPIWLGYFVAFTFGAILVIATLMPSKRSRDDV